MKPILLILLTILFILSINSCKKDYPRDIPDWIKEKIKCCKKKDCSYQNQECAGLVIIEYSYNGNIIYHFTDTDSAPHKVIYYDYNGNLICSYNEYSPNAPCGDFLLKDLKYERTIWTKN